MRNFVSKKSTFFLSLLVFCGLVAPVDAMPNPVVEVNRIMQDIRFNASELQRNMIDFKHENEFLFTTGVIPYIILQRGWMGPTQSTYFAVRFFEVGPMWRPGLPLVPGIPNRVAMEIVRPSYDMTNASNNMLQWLAVNYPPVPGVQPTPWGPRRVGPPMGPVNQSFANLFHFQLEANLRNSFATASLIREALARMYYVGGHPYIYDPARAQLLQYRLWRIQNHLNALRYLLDVAQHSPAFHALGIGVIGTCFAEAYPLFQFEFQTEIVESESAYAVAPQFRAGAYPAVGPVRHGFHSQTYNYQEEVRARSGFRQPVVQGQANIIRTPGVNSIQNDPWYGNEMEPNVAPGQQRYTDQMLLQEQQLRNQNGGAAIGPYGGNGGAVMPGNGGAMIGGNGGAVGGAVGVPGGGYDTNGAAQGGYDANGAAPGNGFGGDAGAFNNGAYGANNGNVPPPQQPQYDNNGQLINNGSGEAYGPQPLNNGPNNGLNNNGLNNTQIYRTRNGQLVNANGQLVNQNGQLIDSNGQVITQQEQTQIQNNQSTSSGTDVYQDNKSGPNTLDAAAANSGAQQQSPQQAVQNSGKGSAQNLPPIQPPPTK